MIGISSLAVFLGSTISGRMGSLYETLPASSFWALHAGVVGLEGVIMLGDRAALHQAPSSTEAPVGGLGRRARPEAPLTPAGRGPPHRGPPSVVSVGAAVWA